MNYKVLALGAAVGFLFALSPSCGQADACEETCNGCCDGDTCIESTETSATACGTGGQQCIACAATQTCDNGTCVGGQTGNPDAGPDGGGCGPANCDGCCATTANSTICLGGTTQTNCGTGGAACSPCTAPEVCTPLGANNGGACQAPDAGTEGVGTACQGNPDAGYNALGMTFAGADECDDVPGNTVFCKTESSYGNLAYQDGHCTRLCYSDTHCGTGAACVYWLGALGEAVNSCYKTCQAQADCRDGYVCIGIRVDDMGNITQRACLPEPTPLPDGGPAQDYEIVDAGPPAPEGTIGATCTDDSECRPPDTGDCIPETLPDGGMTNYWGGFCTADSAYGDDDFCGPGATAMPYLAGNTSSPETTFIVWNCEVQCTTAADCRAGYLCEDYLGVNICRPGDTPPSP